MTTHGRMICRDSSKPAPAPLAPVVTDAELLTSIDEIMKMSVKREMENEQLRTENERLRAALNALLLAIDSKGRGFARAVEMAREARR